MGCQRNTTTKSKKQVVRSEHMVVFGCDRHTCPFVFRLKAIVSGLELFRLFLCARQVAPRFATGCFATLASHNTCFGHLVSVASTLASPQLLRDTCFATLASRQRDNRRKCLTNETKLQRNETKLQRVATSCVATKSCNVSRRRQLRHSQTQVVLVSSSCRACSDHL